MGTNSGKKTIKELMSVMDIELSKTYDDLMLSSTAEDTPDNDYAVITRLSVTVSMLSILLIKVENFLDSDGINYLTYQPKLNSIKDLISALKASMYARSTKVRAKIAESYERTREQELDR